MSVLMHGAKRFLKEFYLAKYDVYEDQRFQSHGLLWIFCHHSIDIEIYTIRKTQRKKKSNRIVHALEFEIQL